MLISSRYIKVIIHVLAWLLVSYIMLMQLQMVLGISLPMGYWIKQVTLLVLVIMYFYANEKWFVPRLLYKQKLASFTVLHLGIITGIQLLGRIFDVVFRIREMLVEAVMRVTHLPLKISNWSHLDDTLLLTSCVSAGISTCIALVQIWQSNLRQGEAMHKKHVDAELALLKAQIHPHFFFNTLNNIYALSFDDVDSSRSSLYKLSRMMRYLLYETPNNLTTLNKELEFVKDYIELMSLRMTDTMEIVFEAPETIEEKPIAPMILLPFIENAFKHGVSSLRDGEIVIRITQQGPLLTLYVANKIFKDKNSRIEDGGIGLTNTERRLEMTYAGKHKLQYGRNEQDNYIVYLELEL